MQRAKRSSSRHSNRSADLLRRRGRRHTVSNFAQRGRLHCACTKPRRSRRIFTWRSRLRIAGKLKPSIARLGRRVEKTMVRLVCARTTTRTTTQLSSLVRTGTTSKWFAWMVNFRVRSLDAMIAQLQKSNIEVKVDPEKYPNGRFARLHDPEGNPIELWEPAP